MAPFIAGVLNQSLPYGGLIGGICKTAKSIHPRLGVGDGVIPTGGKSGNFPRSAAWNRLQPQWKVVALRLSTGLIAALLWRKYPQVYDKKLFSFQAVPVKPFGIGMAMRGDHSAARRESPVP